MRGGQDVLRRKRLLAPLLEALAGTDRLVLLGDLIEFRHGTTRSALAAAEPVLNEIGRAMSSGEVVIVPGNHDHQLVRPSVARWRTGSSPVPPLGLEAALDWRPGEVLETVVRLLDPATVRATYPGAWLRPDLYATHGHYGDRHTTVPIVERLGAGVMARMVAEPAFGPRETEDYEATFGPLYAWIDAAAETGRAPMGSGSGSLQHRTWRALNRSDGKRPVRRAGLAAALPAAVAAMNLAGFGPLRADISGQELRRAALRAFGEVVVRLGAAADHVIFGHTHRAGPLPSDDPLEWLAPNGARLLNTGCWVHEAVFLGRRPGESPYRPGFCAIVPEHGPPELINILDGAVPLEEVTALAPV